MEFNIPERRTEYTIESAVISNARLKDGVLIDIRNNISGFEIYEHINKPYITAKFFFVDHNNILQTFDFSGGEKLSIVLQHTEEKTSGFQIEKDFLIDKIENIIKTDERTEGIVAQSLPSDLPPQTHGAGTKPGCGDLGPRGKRLHRFRCRHRRQQSRPSGPGTAACHLGTGLKTLAHQQPFSHRTSGQTGRRTGRCLLCRSSLFLQLRSRGKRSGD